MKTWNEIKSEADYPPTFERVLLTLEDKDGCRKVVIGSISSVWNMSKAVAWMPFETPEPFGGSRLSPTPEDLEKFAQMGLSAKLTARNLGMSTMNLFNKINKFPELRAIWDKYEHLRREN